MVRCLKIKDDGTRCYRKQCDNYCWQHIPCKPCKPKCRRRISAKKSPTKLKPLVQREPINIQIDCKEMCKEMCKSNPEDLEKLKNDIKDIRATVNDAKMSVDKLTEKEFLESKKLQALADLEAKDIQLVTENISNLKIDFEKWKINITALEAWQTDLIMWKDSIDNWKSKGIPNDTLAQEFQVFKTDIAEWKTNVTMMITDVSSQMSKLKQDLITVNQKVESQYNVTKEWVDGINGWTSRIDALEAEIKNLALDHNSLDQLKINMDNFEVIVKEFQDWKKIVENLGVTVFANRDTDIKEKVEIDAAVKGVKNSVRGMSDTIRNYNDTVGQLSGKVHDIKDTQAADTSKINSALDDLKKSFEDIKILVNSKK